MASPRLGTRSTPRSRAYLCAAITLLTFGCDEGSPPAPHYFNRVIQPILNESCVRSQGACHKDDGTGNALGNLALTSYAELVKRRDVLRPYGSYPVPLLLIKATGADIPPIPYKGREGGVTVFLSSEIDHAGGATISVDSNAFFELQQWMANGANEDGSVTEKPQQRGAGECRIDFTRVRPDVAAQVGTITASTPGFSDFVARVEPVLTQSCAFGTCHSAEQSDFFLTCRGSGDDASKFNFLQAQAFVAQPAETSQLVLKPLAPSAGGIAHTGGVFFQNQDDPSWRALSEWAGVAGSSPLLANLTEGHRFFNDQVMPVFLKRGCALEGCHSPGAANDFKLRAGSRGFFPPFSLAQNYRFARHEFLVPDVPDVRQSRLVKKPVVSTHEGGIGLVHRGGPPLQSPSDGPALDPTACPRPWTEASSPLCTIAEWHRIERQDLLTRMQASPMNVGDPIPLIAVVRPPDPDRAIDFDTYRPGADLVVSQVTVSALGAIDPQSATAPVSLLDNCMGVLGDRANVDVRGPDVSYAGDKVVFAMRLTPADPLDLYEVTLDPGRACTKLTAGNSMEVGGMLAHSLDPMYTPDAAIVFASTRGRPGVGPMRSPKFLQPQSDLWRMFKQGDGYGPAERMTALTGSELSPAMMLNGQIAFTAEKAAPDFYQLSGRRINWDLTDYHPLIAQRAVSPSLDGTVEPSVGYQQATEIREGVDRNFVFILSDTGTKGAGGALGVFNRSIGPFAADRGDITFLRALTIVDPAATGRAGATRGAYRSPFGLPDGRILVSYAPDVTDLATAAQVRYDLVVIDPVTGARTPVANFAGGAGSRVEAVLAYRRERREMFNNVVQLVFGGRTEPTDPAHGVVHYPDLPMLATLLGANLRSGRSVDSLRAARKVAIYEESFAPRNLAEAMQGQSGPERTYSMRKLLGAADLASDGSAHLRLPSLTPLIIELQDGSGRPVFTMREQDQLGPGELISRGVPEPLFNSVCGGCHGSVSGKELDISVDPDALTGASVSLSRDDARRVNLGP